MGLIESLVCEGAWVRACQSARLGLVSWGGNGSPYVKTPAPKVLASAGVAFGRW